jgi:hypothetical protein
MMPTSHANCFGMQTIGLTHGPGCQATGNQPSSWHLIINLGSWTTPTSRIFKPSSVVYDSLRAYSPFGMSSAMR